MLTKKMTEVVERAIAAINPEAPDLEQVEALRRLSDVLVSLKVQEL